MTNARLKGVSFLTTKCDPLGDIAVVLYLGRILPRLENDVCCLFGYSLSLNALPDKR